VGIKEYFTVKKDEEFTELAQLHPILFLILAHMNLWCHNRGTPFVITRMIDEKIEGVSISDTHKEGRAFDLSVRNWSDQDIQEFTNTFNNKYGTSVGAFGLRTGLPSVVVYHVGTAPHLHIQIRPQAR